MNVGRGPCVCVHESQRERGGDRPGETKPQEGGLCLTPHTHYTTLVASSSSSVVSQSDVSVVERLTGLTSNLTSVDSGGVA